MFHNLLFAVINGGISIGEGKKETLRALLLSLSLSLCDRSSTCECSVAARGAYDQMQSHYRQGSHRRDVGDYGYEDYDEYEDEEGGSEEEEEEEEEEDPVKSKEQQEFLSLREKLKERIRQRLKKQAASTSGRQPQVSKRTSMPNDKFGSFFGPSQSVIASRVLDERRSIQETSLVVSRAPSSSSTSTKGSSSTSEKKAHVQHQKARVVNEVKKKAQTLKDMRDYSFLLSDDADFPAPEKELPRPPAVRKPAPVSDGHSAQASSKVKPPVGKPSRPVPNGHESKNSVARNLHSQTRVGPAKGAVVSRPRPASAEHRKVGGGSVTNGSGLSIRHKPLPSKSSAVATSTSRPPAKVANDPGRSIGHKPLPSKSSSVVTSTSRPSAKVANDPHLKKRVSSAVPHPSIQKNHHSEQRRPSERPEKVRTTPKQPLPSTKSQMAPSKKISVRDSRENKLKKMPVKRRFDDDDDDDDGDNAIQMIRAMFKYDPSRFVGVDEDDRNMEANFSQIEKEELNSAKIAKEEDDEQFRLIEEEERRERMRKKQKLSRR